MKYEIPTIEYFREEKAWSEIFKIYTSQGRPWGNYAARARFRIMRMSCVATIVRDSNFSSGKFDIKRLHYSQQLHAQIYTRQNISIHFRHYIALIEQ